LPQTGHTRLLANLFFLSASLRQTEHILGVCRSERILLPQLEQFSQYIAIF